MSMTSLPFDRPAATPFSPNSTSSTSGVSGTMVMMMSAASASGLGAIDDWKPLSSSSLGAAARMSR
jgi:hypothetical protein